MTKKRETMDDRIQEALRAIERRRAMLERLRSPADKRTLVESLDCSRATVDRAIRRLEGWGWIERDDDGWRLTHAGRTILDRYLRFRTAFGEVMSGTEALPSLPPSADVDAAVFEGGIVEASVGERLETDGPSDGLPTPVRRRVGDADRIQLVAPEETAAMLLSSCRELASGTIEAVLDPAALSRLPDRTPELARWLVAVDRVEAYAADTPPYALLLFENGNERTVSVVSHRTDRSVEGVVTNDTAAAIEWGKNRYRSLRRSATPLADAVEWGGIAARTDPDPADTLDREGFLELSPAYFAERETLPLPTAWRVGIDFPEIAAGHALEREHVQDGERRSLVEDLLSALSGGGTRALVGPPGSGKSTVCRDVAYRWYRTTGSVLYRPEGGPEPFESWRALVRLLSDRPRPTLVVVEDALRADVRAVFRAIEQLEDDSAVAFLLESSADRWEVDGTFDVDPHDEAVRERIETVRIPALDATERNRFRDKLETVVDVPVDDVPLDASQLQADSMDATDGESVEDGAAVDTHTGVPPERRDGANPGVLLLFLHRLVMQIEPFDADATADTTDRTEAGGGDGIDPGQGSAAAGEGSEPTDSTTPGGDRRQPEPAAAGGETASRGTETRATTGLDTEIARTCASLRGDELAMDTAVLVNLLNAAGLPVAPEYAYALAVEAGDGIGIPSTGTTGDTIVGEEGVSDRIRRVERALDRLSGQVLFGDPGNGRCRTVHAGWSTAFLQQLLETDGRAAVGRVDRCVSTLLALADDEEARERIRDLRAEGPLSTPPDGTDPFDRIAEDSAGWVESITRRLVEFGGEYPALTPLFCGHREPTFTIPGACPSGLRAELTERCGRAHLSGGRLEEATRSFESALDRLERTELAADDRLRLRARCRVGLGQVAVERGEYDEAETLYRNALAAYRELDDQLGIADSLRHLGSVAQLRSNLDAAETRYARSLRIYLDLGANRKTAQALSDLGSVAQDRGDFETARRHYHESRRRYAAVGARQELVDVLCKLATVGWVTGDLDAAEKRARRAAAVGREIGYESGFATAQYHLAVVSNVRGNTDAAREYADRAVDSFAAIGNTHHEASVRSLLGEIERTAGNLDRAETHYEAAASRHERLDDDRALLDALLGLGRVANERGALDRAAEYAERALEAAREVGDARSEAACLRLLGGIDRERGEFARAETRLEDALSGYREVEERHGEAAAALELAELAADRGDRDRARELFERSVATYREVDAAPDAADALEQFADRCAEWGADEEARRRHTTAERLRDSDE